MYLDIDRLPEIIEKYYATSSPSDSRLVGLEPRFEAAYFDIVRFFGAHSVDPFEIPLTYLPNKFNLTEARVKEFAGEIRQQMLAEGRIFAGPPVMRLCSFDPTAKRAVVQEADYGEQAGSSFALDLPHPLFSDWGTTLRAYWKSNYPSLRLEDNPIGICLGVSAMLIIEDEGERYVLLVRRHSKLASLESTVGPSIAGVVDFNRQFQSFGELLVNMLVEETEEEIGLVRSEIELVPLAYAREIFRGDRPQLFGVALTKFPRYQLKRLLEQKRAEAGEFDAYTFALIKNGRVDSRYIELMNFEAKMTYFLAEEFLSIDGQ